MNAERQPAARAAAALLVCALAAGGAAQGNALVIAPTAALAEGNEALPGPGLPQALRMQVLIDQIHLGPLVGRPILGLRLRRQGHTRPFPAGAALWTVRIGAAPHFAAEGSAIFAANLGPPLGLANAQPVPAPPSPTPTGTITAWQPNNTLQVLLQAPLPYSGGTLCLDIAARPDPTQPAAAWPIDAFRVPRQGTAVQRLGPGCGAFAPTWSFVEEASLTLGSTAKFSAIGPPGALALFFVGTQPLAAPVPLDAFGSAPGCLAYLADTPVSMTAVFSQPLVPGDPALGGLAALGLQIPAAPTFLGATLLDHWLDLGQPQFATSGAHAFTIAQQPPGLGITTVLAQGAQAATGTVLVDFGPALQLLY
ncbi:MAG: hypothetical protein AB7O97_04450 [Planctomycetota bacterium]